MAYQKQTWVDGVTPLNAEHLNHMEQGIGQLSEENVTLSAAQINALDGMFKVVAYDADSGYAAAYVAFQTAFGLTGSGESGGEETGVSNESTWTSGVAYTFDAVQNEYVSEKDGSFITYNDWNRTPYLYCKGAAVLRAVVNAATSMLSTNNGYNAFYDESKNFIKGFSVAGIDGNTVGSYTDIEVPANAAYFTASHKAGVIGTRDSSFSNALGFVPYSEVLV